MSAPSTFATFIRGGTSKALFFHEKDIPAPGPIRDEFLIRIMGSPDPSQIDGMGGTRIVTSKVAIIRPSKRPDADVDFTFAQIGLGESRVAYDANCGNISAGVGPFAINEKLVKEEVYRDGNRVVRIYNTGTDVILVAHVPIDEKTGRALEKGDYAISGCPGTAAPILMDYSKTAKPQTMLPTGNTIDSIECSFGTVETTYCEVGNPIVFVDATAMGIKGDEMPQVLDNNGALLAHIREVRGRVAQSIGRCKDWSKVDEQSPMLPMVALVSAPTTKTCDIQSRLFLDNHCHPAMAGTASVCTTALSRLPGSVVNRLVAPKSLQNGTFNIQHPAGFIPVTVRTEHTSAALPVFDVLGFVRTARYLFQGQLFIPADIQGDWAGPSQSDVP